MAANPIKVSFNSVPDTGSTCFTCAWYIVPSCLHLPSTGQAFFLHVHFLSELDVFLPNSFFFIVPSDYLLNIRCCSVAYFYSVSVEDLVEWIGFGET